MSGCETNERNEQAMNGCESTSKVQADHVVSLRSDLTFIAHIERIEQLASEKSHQVIRLMGFLCPNDCEMSEGTNDRTMLYGRNN